MNTWYFDNEHHCLRWLNCNPEHPMLVFVHGLGCAASSDYPPVITSSEYPEMSSLLVDLPGAGFSDKPDTVLYDSDTQAQRLQHWLTDSGNTSLSLFGHSAGTFIALKLMQKLSVPPEQLILCTPGLNDYGISLLNEITSMSETGFVRYGFSALMMKLKAQGRSDAWLGPFQVSSPQAIWQWAKSALSDNARDWIGELAKLSVKKGVILPDNTSETEVLKYIQAGCSVELVPESGHMMAYDAPDGLARAISNLTGGCSTTGIHL